MSSEQNKMDRRTLLVLGAASVVPACAAGGGDSLEVGPFNPANGGSNAGNGGANGAGGANGSGPTTTSSSAGGPTTSSSSGHTSTSTSASSSTTSTTTSASSSSTTSSTTTTASSSSGGTTCPTPANSHRLTFSQYPALMNAGGSVSFSGSGFSDSNCQQPNIIVVSKGGGTYLAFSASCSHSCCIVKLSGSNFHCPCHGANFNTTTGASESNIAPSGLDVLKVCADSTGITVSW